MLFSLNIVLFEALVIVPKEKDYKAQWGKKTEESNKMTQ